MMGSCLGCRSGNKINNRLRGEKKEPHSIFFRRDSRIFPSTCFLWFESVTAQVYATCRWERARPFSRLSAGLTIQTASGLDTESGSKAGRAHVEWYRENGYPIEVKRQKTVYPREKAMSNSIPNPGPDRWGHAMAAPLTLISIVSLVISFHHRSPGKHTKTAKPRKKEKRKEGLKKRNHPRQLARDAPPRSTPSMGKSIFILSKIS